MKANELLLTIAETPSFLHKTNIYISHKNEVRLRKIESVSVHDGTIILHTGDFVYPHEMAKING